MDHKLYIIVAADEMGGIGKDGTLPWHLPDELKYFQQVTTETTDPEKHNMLIMGRTTWESIPAKHRPLKNRVNVVLTRNPDYLAEGATIQHSLDDAIQTADKTIESIFIIGGAQVFSQALERMDLTGIYLTRLHATFDCDTFLPEMPSAIHEPAKQGEAEEGGVSYTYLFYASQE